MLYKCRAGLKWYPFGGWHHTNDHGWLFKRSPRFTNGIYWEAALFLRAPFTKGCDGVNQPCPLAARVLLYLLHHFVEFSSVHGLD